ncbi:class I SAM-dependent methyltransferase [Actinopolymorpha sp. NPDC004070]|uniref:class I SAM-dependent DNA methyltransferase n=1 Tax=Actinopolymorpha sp. NPDC004070 TaxID=3154548 RepID=UPI0033A12C3C
MSNAGSDGMREPLGETRQTYDVIAGEYARQNSSGYPRLLETIASLAACLPPGALVADVGCGPGREMRLLGERGLRVVGFDLSIGQLRAGGQSGVAQADMRQLPVRTGSVDAVWCQAALLHIPREAVPTVIGELGRVVHESGHLYLSVAEGDGEGWEIASSYGATQRRWFTYHREEELTALLSSAGFEVRAARRTRSHRDWLSVHCRRISD